MSQMRAAAKLTSVTSTPAQPVELTVSFNRASNPPAGTVRDCMGHEQPFDGWLGLLGLLETRCQDQVRTGVPTTRPEDP